jgi:hypothetical protein
MDILHKLPLEISTVPALQRDLMVMEYNYIDQLRLSSLFNLRKSRMENDNHSQFFHFSFSIFHFPLRTAICNLPSAISDFSIFDFQFLLKKGTEMTPRIKPPACAQNATPPASPPMPNERYALNACIANHKPRNIQAENSMKVMKKNIGTSVSTFARGNITTYAPSTPAMAPLAPIIGTIDA